MYNKSQPKNKRPTLNTKKREKAYNKKTNKEARHHSPLTPSFQLEDHKVPTTQQKKFTLSSYNYTVIDIKHQSIT